MIEKETILIEGREFDAFSIKTDNTSILLIKALHGILGCGYFSIEAADKFSDSFAIVRGVKDFEDMLEASVAKVSKAASKKGVREGMKGKEALLLMDTVKKQ